MRGLMDIVSIENIFKFDEWVIPVQTLVNNYQSTSRPSPFSAWSSDASGCGEWERNRETRCINSRWVWKIGLVYLSSLTCDQRPRLQLPLVLPLSVSVTESLRNRFLWQKSVWKSLLEYLTMKNIIIKFIISYVTRKLLNLSLQLCEHDLRCSACS